MGSCCCVQGTEQEKQINRQINNHMKAENQMRSTTHKILLLGPGDSGKTTVLKQMRKIHSDTIPSDTIDSYSSYIRSKIMNYMKILSKQSLKLNISLPPSDEYSSQDMEASREFMINLSSPCDITPEIVNHMKLLWNNQGIQETLNQREKFQIPDNVSYFFDDRLDDIVSDPYIPTFDDYLRIRMRTTGFNEESFITYLDANGQSTIYTNNNGNNNNNNNNNNNINNINGHNKLKSLSTTSPSGSASHSQSQSQSNNTANAREYKDLEFETEKEAIAIVNNKNNKSNFKGTQHTFTFMDVGGQRAERKKWMNMLQDNIDAVVYIIAISEYDLMCFEDSSTLRLTEALNLFGAVLEKGFMKNKTVALFFNKYDLLIEKLQDESKSTIKDHFPAFPDDKDPRDPFDVCEFVYQLFLEKYQRLEKNPHQTPHYHRTSALDTDQIQHVMSDIQSDLIRMQLRLAGF